MSWYVEKDGTTGGPHDEAKIIQALLDKPDPLIRICAVGASEWRDIASHPPFAAALRKAMPPPAPIPAMAAPAPYPWPPCAMPLPQDKDLFGAFFVLLPMLAGLASLVFGAPGLFTVAVVVASAIFAAVDAPKWKLPAISHSVGMFCLWLFVFPAHFHGRGKAGAKYGLGEALVSMFLWAGCLFVVTYVMRPVVYW